MDRPMNYTLTLSIVIATVVFLASYALLSIQSGVTYFHTEVMHMIELIFSTNIIYY